MSMPRLENIIKVASWNIQSNLALQTCVKP
jgi:hypothetical protein